MGRPRWIRSVMWHRSSRRRLPRSSRNIAWRGRPPGSCTGTRSPGSTGWGSPTSPRVALPTSRPSIGRVDHEDLHGHRDPPAARRGHAPSGRPGGRAPARAGVDDEPLRAIETVTIRRMLSHESGLTGRSARARTGGFPTTKGRRSGTSARAGEVTRRPAEHPTEVLEPGVPAARGDRGASQRRAVPGVRAGAAPRAARHAGLGVRAAVRGPARPSGDRVRRQIPVRRARSGLDPSERCGPKGACGRASRISAAGSRSSSGRTGERATGHRSSRASH